MVDVTLACDDGQQIQAHRLILSAGSLFFRNIFTSFQSHPHSFIFLSEIRKRDLLNTIEFLYSGEINISNDEVKNFLDVARKLQIQGIPNTDIREREIKDHEKINDHEENNDHAEINDHEGKKISHTRYPESMQKVDDNATLGDKLSEEGKFFGADQILKTEQNKDIENDFDDIKNKENYRIGIQSIEDGDIDNVFNEEVEDCGENLDDQRQKRKHTDHSPIKEELLREKADDNNEIVDFEKIDDLWECNYCGKTFVRKNHAKSHAEIHMNNVLHSCEVCNKSFRTKDSLRVHVRMIHTDETFVCTVCGKSGLSKIAFKNHKYQSKCAKRKI